MKPPLTPYQRIRRRFDFNMRRVDNLLTISENIAKDKKTVPSQIQDVLRSTVVLLHASLEDLLREVVRWNYPIANSEFAKSLRLEMSKKNRKEKFTIEDLISFRGKTIDEVLDSSVRAHLERRSFNSIEEIVAVIKLIGLEKDDFEPGFAAIGACIERRHKIVHQSDRTEHREETHGAPSRITRATVVEWSDATKTFGNRLLRQVRPRAVKKPKKNSN